MFLRPVRCRVHVKDQAKRAEAHQKVLPLQLEDVLPAEPRLPTAAANPPVSRFTCYQCEASFYRRFTLENHIVTLKGTGENFTCATCGKVFDRPDKLKRHTNISHEKLAVGRGSLPATSVAGFLTGATR